MGRFSVPNLRWITIDKLENLKSLPECMQTLFPSLTSLIIKYCPQLELFSDGGLPSSLDYLCVIGCSKLLIASLKWAWGIHTSLDELHIEKVDVESFPDQERCKKPDGEDWGKISHIESALILILSNQHWLHKY
ncbi:hypothetical protein P8452_74564 [Trifolium repens]|nr:hypothetical protein P8452_74564 [Trifolium repens]